MKWILILITFFLLAFSPSQWWPKIDPFNEIDINFDKRIGLPSCDPPYQLYREPERQNTYGRFGCFKTPPQGWTHL